MAVAGASPPPPNADSCTRAGALLLPASTPAWPKAARLNKITIPGGYVPKQ